MSASKKKIIFINGALENHLDCLVWICIITPVIVGYWIASAAKLSEQTINLTRRLEHVDGFLLRKKCCPKILWGICGNYFFLLLQIAHSSANLPSRNIIDRKSHKYITNNAHVLGVLVNAARAMATKWRFDWSEAAYVWCMSDCEPDTTFIPSLSFHVYIWILICC